MLKRVHIHYAGVIFLLTGLVSRLLIPSSSWPIILIMIGGTLKLSHVIIDIITKTYRPGKELLLLVLGLMVFFTGIYLKRNMVEYGVLVMITGLVMKVSFLILYVRKKSKQAS